MNELTPEQKVINDIRPITEVNHLLEAQKNELYIFNENDKKFYEIPEGHVFDVLTVEYYKPVPNFLNYMTTTNGNIYSIIRNNYLTKSICGGYYYCKLFNTNYPKGKSLSFHSVIANTFLPEDETRNSIDHIDINKENNLLINLRRANGSEQAQNQNQPFTQNHGTPVIMYDKDDDKYETPIKNFSKQIEAAEYIMKEFPGKYSGKESIRKGIGSACNNKKPTSHGFRWKYDTSLFDTYEWFEIKKENIKGQIGYVATKCGLLGNIIRDKNNKIINKTILNGYIRPTNGYKIQKFGKGSKNYRVHRIIALTFIPNDDPDNKVVVNHKNGIKHDNRVENLEWCTQSHNMQHSADMHS
jgi:hypothetical protein